MKMYNDKFYNLCNKMLTFFLLCFFIVFNSKSRLYNRFESFLRNRLSFYNRDMLILRHTVHVFICTYVLKLADYRLLIYETKEIDLMLLNIRNN